MKETSVEKRLIREVRAEGGMVEKIMPIVAGLPDRLVLLWGVVHLIETKAPDGDVRPAQRVWHAKAAKAGVHVWLVWDGPQVTEWIEARRKERQ